MLQFTNVILRDDIKKKSSLYFPPNFSRMSVPCFYNRKRDYVTKLHTKHSDNPSKVNTIEIVFKTALAVFRKHTWSQSGCAPEVEGRQAPQAHPSNVPPMQVSAFSCVSTPNRACY